MLACPSLSHTTAVATKSAPNTGWPSSIASSRYGAAGPSPPSNGRPARWACRHSPPPRHAAQANPPTYATSNLTQLWVLFSRRYRSITDDPFMVAYLHFQNVVVAFVVGFAFSYEAGSEQLREPSLPPSRLRWLVAPKPSP